MTFLITLLLSTALLLALLWLLFGRHTSKADLSAAALAIQKLLPVHCQHFPQIHQLLKTEDREFMERRAPRPLASQWRGERRQVLRLYMRGLARDFHGLEELARLIAALSPEIKRRQEWEWLWLGVQFRLLYGLTLMRFALYSLPSGELARLTEMLASLALALEHSIDRLTEAFPKAETATTI